VVDLRDLYNRARLWHNKLVGETRPYD